MERISSEGLHGLNRIVRLDRGRQFRLLTVSIVAWLIADYASNALANDLIQDTTANQTHRSRVLQGASQLRPLKVSTAKPRFS